MIDEALRSSDVGAQEDYPMTFVERLPPALHQRLAGMDGDTMQVRSVTGQSQSQETIDEPVYYMKPLLQETLNLEP